MYGLMAGLPFLSRASPSVADLTTTAEVIVRPLVVPGGRAKVWREFRSARLNKSNDDQERLTNSLVLWLYLLTDSSLKHRELSARRRAAERVNPGGAAHLKSWKASLFNATFPVKPRFSTAFLASAVVFALPKVE